MMMRRIKLILKNLGCKDVDWMSYATSCSHSDHNLDLLNVQYEYVHQVWNGSWNDLFVKTIP